MASPFRTFRKNQKVWMAAITIMAIVAFVFMSGPMLSFSRMGGGPPAAIETKYGKLTGLEISMLRQQRRMLSQFLNVLHSYYASDPKTFRQADVVDMAVLNLLGPETDNEAIDHWIYARAAESIGVVVDDDSVNRLLTAMLVGVPEPQKLLDFAIRYSGQGMGGDVLRRILKEQLLALRFMQLGHQYDEWAGFSASPAERWEYFKRLHQEATTEVALLTPQDFVKAVKEPTDKELEDFFEQHKNAEASPDSAQPGFRVPRRVSVDYLEMDEDKIRDGITDAEIQQEYEKDPKVYARDKEEFEKEEKQDKEARAKEEKGVGATKTAPETNQWESKTPAPKTTGEKALAAGNKSQAAASTGTKPAAKPETKSGAKPGPEVKSSPAKQPEPVKPASTATKPTGSSFYRPQSPFRLVAFAEDKAAAPAASSAEKKGVAAPLAPKPTAANPAPAAKAVVTTPVQAGAKLEPKPSGAAPVKGTNPTDKTKSGQTDKAASGMQPSPEPVAGVKVPSAPTKTAKERLDDLIRGTLAARKMREIRTKVKADLDAFQSEWANAEEDKKPTLDVAALAKKYGMTAHKTGLVSKQQITDTPFGKSQVISPETGRPEDITGELFGPTTLYKIDFSTPPLFATPKRLEYLFWKTADVPGKVPSWTDPGIKDEVRREKKLVEARTLAADAAKALKADAEKKENKGKSLKALVTAKKETKIEVMEPPPFTWLTNPMTGQPPEISEVGDLTKPGAEFMKKVFAMHSGQVEVAANVPKSEFYVVRMIGLTPFQELFDDFTSPETPQYYVMLVVNAVRAKVDPAWHAQVLADANFKDNRNKLKEAAEGQSPPSPGAPEGPPPTSGGL